MENEENIFECERELNKEECSKLKNIFYYHNGSKQIDKKKHR